MGEGKHVVFGTCLALCFRQFCKVASAKVIVGAGLVVPVISTKEAASASVATAEIGKLFCWSF